MAKIKASDILKGAKLFVEKHNHEILTAIGIGGMLTTTVLAVKATPKALARIEHKKLEENKAKLTPVEVVKETWKEYIPAAITGTVSTACLIGACSVSTRRTAALATAYKISETALHEYKEQVIETIGETKEQQIREKVAKERVENNPVKSGDVIVTNKGETLCYDSISGRYFKSDIDRIKKIANELNRRMLTDAFGYVSVNEFYDELGLDGIGVGDDLGWNVSSGLIDIELSSCLTPDDQPCVAINFVIVPKYDYSSFS